MQSYLRDLELVFNALYGLRNNIVSAGADQGSIFGPDLWNIAYNRIPRLEMPRETLLVGYVDGTVNNNCEGS